MKKNSLFPRLSGQGKRLVTLCRGGVLIAVFGAWPACWAQSVTATFDLDTGTPVLTGGQNTPFDQTSGGVTAHFTGPFSIQTGLYTLSQFSGKYLYPNSPGALDITFSQPVTNISLVFATTDFNQAEPATILQLTAYVDSTGNTPVGSVTAQGLYPGETSHPNDSMPQGTLALASAQPFNLVEVKIAPNQPLAGSSFLVDNITIIAVPPPVIPQLTLALTATDTAVVSWPASVTGYVLQENCALGTTNWVNTTNAVHVVGDQNQVIVSPLAANCFFRLFHP